MKKSTKVFLLIVLVLVGIKAYDLIFEPNKIFPGRTAIFSEIELLLIILGGFLGMYLGRKIRLPEVWNENIRNLKGVVRPILIGLIFGGLLIIFDYFARIGDINVGWPLSVPFYLWGAVSTEVILHYLPLTAVTWLIGSIILRERYNDIVYWTLGVLLSLFAVSSMLMAFSIPEIPLNNPGTIMLTVLGVITFVSELAAIKIIKEWGLVSAIIYRLSIYSLWHIIWPLIIY